jgi:TrmH family RNA methyltransferase
MSIKHISSRDNPLYKELRLLASSSQARRKAGRTLLDGIHLCETYLDKAGKPLQCVVGDSAQSHPEVAVLMDKCQKVKVSCTILPDALFQSLSQVENGIDILFSIETPTPAIPNHISSSAVLLDRLQDPGNLGSILRSAAAAGISSVFCSPETVFAWSPKVLRAGMGAHFLLNIHENIDLEGLLKNAALPVIATSSHADKSIYDLNLKNDVAWLFGHEGQGVSERLFSLASHKAVIPHMGEVESLNVAASAAVCFFEQVRQKKTSAIC